MSPGEAMSAQFSGGATDVLQVIAALAVMVGVLMLWKYVKSAAGDGAVKHTQAEFDEFHERMGFRNEADPKHWKNQDT